MWTRSVGQSSSGLEGRTDVPLADHECGVSYVVKLVRDQGVVQKDMLPGLLVDGIVLESETQRVPAPRGEWKGAALQKATFGHGGTATVPVTPRNAIEGQKKRSES